jgi:hypothetical protein
MTATRTGRVRHYVIAARDLEATCDEIYDYLDLEPAPQDHREDGSQVTEQYGFRTHMMRVGTTMLEVVSPIRERHELQKFFVEQGGDGGFMVVMQTYDDDALLARADAAGLPLRFEIPDFLGQHLMQFDYQVLGTRFEHYPYTPEDNWWGDPLNGAYNDPGAVADIVGATVAVNDPAAIAELTSTVFIGTREANAVRFIDRRIEFVPPVDGKQGLNALHLTVRDRARAGEAKRIANVDFRLV